MSGPARLVVLTRDDPASSVGGVETFTGLLLRVFPGSEVVAYAGAAGRRLYLNEARDARAVLQRLATVVERVQPAAIVANGAAAWALDRDGGAASVPVVTVYHGTYAGFGRAIAPVYPWRGLISRTYGAWMERRAGRKCAAVVAVSARVAAEASAFYGVDARVIENCASLDETAGPSRADARRELELTATVPLVLFVGRGDATKGFDRVVTLARRRTDVTLLAAGVAAGPDLPANLHALGIVGPARMRSLLAAADVVVLPSLYEGCPFALIEAVMGDRPIVATATGCFAGMDRSGMDATGTKEDGRDACDEQPYGILLPSAPVMKADGAARQRQFEEAVAAVLESPRRFTPRAACAERFAFARFARQWCDLIAEVRHAG